MTGRTRVLYLAVLPSYRQACVSEMGRQSGDAVTFFAGERQLDTSVSTGVRRDDYTPVRNIPVYSRFFLQVGHWGAVARADTVILDLNPRSLTAWLLTILRRLRGRRTLLWGHLHPRAGSSSKTAGLRRAMRRLADGTVLYGYDGVPAARRELPRQEVWVAPNSLYRRSEMGAATLLPRSGEEDPRVLYVGRLVPAKKVALAIEALAEPEMAARGVQLDVIGGGQEEFALRALAAELGVADRVHFHGWVEDPARLREYYSRSVCALSPGYAGLSLTQSLGFGVPFVVADDEPHAPEIELSRLGGVRYFAANSPRALAAAIREEIDGLEHQDRPALAAAVMAAYSAESMADGLLRALDGVPQHLGDDGWPPLS